MTRSFVAAAAILLVCGASLAQQVTLACHGIMLRTENNGARNPAASTYITVQIDTAKSTLSIEGISCWAGRGDCTKLALRSSASWFEASGDGSLTGTGAQTFIRIDRRSGSLILNQAKDMFGRGDVAFIGKLSEHGEFVCQGGVAPAF